MSEEMISEDESGQLVLKTPMLKVLRDLQRDVTAGFARIEKAIDGKADKSDMARIEARLDEHGRAIADLQNWRHDREYAAASKDRLSEGRHRKREHWYLAMSAGAGAAAAIGIFLSVFHP